MGGRFKSPPTWLLRTVLPQWAPLRWHVGRTVGDEEGDEEEELDAAHEGRGGEDTSLPKSQADTDLWSQLGPRVCLFVCLYTGSRFPQSEQTDTNKHTNIFCFRPELLPAATLLVIG